ncbi:MAG: cytochrome c biogenesis protein CcsA [Deltaproteobacteria bacterium]|nr:cytochrome c biogenesis protein CcsA [Deltaproteobacteria bacterium]
MNNFGDILIWLALFALSVSSAGYIVLCRKKEHKAATMAARIGFVSFAAFMTIASIHLMLLILNHDFTYSYIVQYSSRDLALEYLISSFWAGQEGSFLLWVLLGSWLGLLLMFRARKMEQHVMLIYNLNNIFLTILLIKQSPFNRLLFPPPDGQGLNMLLQDPWMVIHPPIVFLGYAAFAVPFAYAVTAMWKRKYDAWIKPTLPWTLFALVTLGAGIIIGGYWSYKVLGWGGYWAWDPVENASLLPWLLIIALIHGMLLQYKRKKLYKTNFILAVSSFILIIYCTFLTRSGVLADFSVHSFVDLGITGWLVFFILAFLIISLGLFFLRLKDMPLSKKGNNINFFSREFGLISAIILLCVATILIGLGTSAPLITRLLEKASKVSMQYYVDTTLPLGVLMAFLLSIVPLMTWGKNSFSKLAPGLISVIICASVSGIITLVSGYHGIGALLFSLFAGAAVCINLFLAAQFIRKKITLSGAAIAHLGVGLMFIGFVASSVYDHSDKTLLKQGQAQNIMGYEFTLNTPEFLKEGKGFRLSLPLNVKKGESQFAALPDIYAEPGRNGQTNRFIHPHIQRGLLADLYIAPVNYDSGKKEAGFNKQILLKKGDTIQLQDYELTFTGFEVSSMMGAADSEDKDMAVGANILASYKGRDPVNLKPVIIMGQTTSPSGNVKLPGPKEACLTLSRIDATTKSISLVYHEHPDAAPEEDAATLASLLMDVSVKPGMTLLWAGVFLLLLGGSIANVRRCSDF